MQLVQFGNAADSRSRNNRGFQGGASDDQSDFSGSDLEDQCEPGVRSQVERQFMQMNKVHDRIRDEFLGNLPKQTF